MGSPVVVENKGNLSESEFNLGNNLPVNRRLVIFFTDLSQITMIERDISKSLEYYYSSSVDAQMFTFWAVGRGTLLCSEKKRAKAPDKVG